MSFLILAAFTTWMVRGESAYENPACWVDGHSYERCCGSEPVFGCFGSPADLHTKERCCNSPCGTKLRARIDSEGCHATAHWDVTVVTGLWNLKREHWAGHIRYQEGEGRAYTRYLSWLDELLRKRQAMVLFLDAEAANFAKTKRSEYGLEHLTCVLDVGLEELPQMHWHDEYLAAHDENRKRLPGDNQPEVIYANYTLTVNSKPELLACAAHWNPFGSQTFAWIDAGSGRKGTFPLGSKPFVFPTCQPWSLCVGRRMWLFFDFRSKLKRLEHGSTFDSTVLLGTREGVLLYALWFQWAIEQYLAENIMDDEQSVIADIWWMGQFNIQSFYGMTWTETLQEMLQADKHQSKTEPGSSLSMARDMGHWFGVHPNLVWRNTGRMWVPFPDNVAMVREVQVNQMTDEHLELLAYGLWCVHRRFGYYANFCDAHAKKITQVVPANFNDLPIVGAGNTLTYPDPHG